MHINGNKQIVNLRLYQVTISFSKMNFSKFTNDFISVEIQPLHMCLNCCIMVYDFPLERIQYYNILNRMWEENIFFLVCLCANHVNFVSKKFGYLIITRTSKTKWVLLLLPTWLLLCIPIQRMQFKWFNTNTITNVLPVTNASTNEWMSVVSIGFA